MEAYFLVSYSSATGLWSMESELLNCLMDSGTCYERDRTDDPTTDSGWFYPEEGTKDWCIPEDAYANLIVAMSDLEPVKETVIVLSETGIGK
jgi:hypothetical protein